MDEFHRNVLSVCGGGAAPERQQTSSAQKTAGHLFAGPRQALRVSFEQTSRGGVAGQEPIDHECSDSGSNSSCHEPFLLAQGFCPADTQALKACTTRNHPQQIRGKGSPTSMSTTRAPP